MSDIFDINDNDEPKNKILRAPFPYPGGKSRSVNKILEHLPATNTYVEPFGGSGVVLLSRRQSGLEVFNDRYAGVVAFYRCIRNKTKMNALCDILDLTIYSREDFTWCKETWEKCDTDVERAARWFYMLVYSFASLGRNWGRALTPVGKMAGRIQRKIKNFHDLHERLKNVQIENQDWYDCLIDYDSPDTVFYIDPPYINTDTGIYKNKMNLGDHEKLLETIFSLKGFCAVSGYSNPFYDERGWDNKFSWNSFVSIQSGSGKGDNSKRHLEGLEKRGNAEECLWIKEAE